MGWKGAYGGLLTEEKEREREKKGKEIFTMNILFDKFARRHADEEEKYTLTNTNTSTIPCIYPRGIKGEKRERKISAPLVSRANERGWGKTKGRREEKERENKDSKGGNGRKEEGEKRMHEGGMKGRRKTTRNGRRRERREREKEVRKDDREKNKNKRKKEKRQEIKGRKR